MDVRVSTLHNADVISCKLCNTVYKNPLLLECLHSFCSDCLHSYVEGSISDDPKSEMSRWQLTCPLCLEITPLTTDGVDGLMKNSLLDRFISQAQKETTILVADREARESSRRNYLFGNSAGYSRGDTENDEHVFTNAGQHSIENFEKISDGDEDVSSSTGPPYTSGVDVETRELRFNMQTQLSSLQGKAMDVVTAVDQVNQTLEEWIESKSKLKECIKQRSLVLQDHLKAIERKLLTEVDNRSTEQEMKAEVSDVKKSLHGSLKGILNAIDFLKLLAEFGNKEELHFYQGIVEDKVNKLALKDIDISHKESTLKMPHFPVDAQVEELFGTLTEYSGTRSVWDARKSDLSRSSESITSSESERRPLARKTPIETTVDTYLMPRIEYAHDKQAQITNNEDCNESTKTEVKFEQRRPLKSLSFDAASLSEMSEVYTTLSKLKSNKKGVESNDDTNNSGDTADTPFEDTETQTTNPYETLQYWSSAQRRVSAPPLTIRSTLAKRQLNALSILERSNISTDGYTINTDVESGLNQARLEWMRDNVRRKAAGWKTPSVAEHS